MGNKKAKRNIPENLDLLSLRASRCDKLFEEADSQAIDFIEITRLKNGLSREEMSALLGTSYYTYIHWQNVNRKMSSIKPLLRFCYIFGYDMESFVSSAELSTENDLASIELGARIASLSDASLDKLKEAILTLDEPSGQKKGILSSIEAYKATRAMMFKNIAKEEKRAATQDPSVE